MNKSTPVLLCALTGSLIFSFFQWREIRKLRDQTAGNPSTAAVKSSPRNEQAAPEAEMSTGNPDEKASSVHSGNGSTLESVGKGVRHPLKAVLKPDGTFAITDAAGSPVLVSTAREMTSLVSEVEAALTAGRIKLPGGPSWSPGQSAGSPDTAEAMDAHTAWAPAAQDSGHEWLNLKYAKAVELSEVTVYESYNAGALTRVLAILPDGSEKVLWSGAADAEEGIVERVVSVPPGILSDQIRVELDTSRVPGWNEIDAVELVGTDGSRQWAAEATASSYYGEGRNPGP
ncbi:MAG: hypothetical protein EOP86_00390 [Verrucomicrobiaceae bacterium]|nr:MAG: hypothetical protein EOP86_00390 [Verrucomicrobiaceae bacterium]